MKKPRYIDFLKENRTHEQAVAIYNQRIKDSSIIFEKFSAKFVLRDCPVCGNNEVEPQDKFNNQYNIAKCKFCASVYVNPSPSLEALDYYYNHCVCNKSFGQLLKSRAGQGGIILTERCKHVLKLIHRVQTTKSNIRVLEVGCHSGSFLEELRQHLPDKGQANYVELVGIDIDKSAIDNPVSSALSLHHASAEEFVNAEQDGFDLVLHFELLEHLHAPFEFCRALKNLLNKTGLMYFHTPNALGLDNQALGYNDFRPLAHGIFPPMHLNAFTTQNINHFLLRAGFKLLEISTPGNFDVDIIRRYGDTDGVYSLVKGMTGENNLAILQQLIRAVNGSSHLAVLATK